MRFVLVLGMALCAEAAAQTASQPDPWAQVRFLVGTWEAKTTNGSAQAQGAGVYTFRMELRDHVLARHSTYSACKGPEDFNCEHSDLLYLYSEGPAHELRAIYFDNEGHVIHYDVSVPRPGSVELLSDPSQPGPQFRLIYELNEELMTGKFQIRMPGKSEFASYLEWSGKREKN